MTDEEYREYDEIVADLCEEMYKHLTYDKKLILVLSPISVRDTYQKLALEIAKIISAVSGAQVYTLNTCFYKWMHRKTFRNIKTKIWGDALDIDDFMRSFIEDYKVAPLKLIQIYEEYYGKK